MRNVPFIFRAPQPLKSTKKGFQFKPITEQERIVDDLRKNELFETDKFDRLKMIQNDLHRTSTKTRWISPKGFTVVTKKPDFSMPSSTRSSILKDGFKTINQTSTFTTPAINEPYEDPKLDPGFVRTTKDYLKDSLKKKVEKQIRRE